MGIWYELVNFTKRERVSFIHVGAKTARELTGNPAAAAIATWYILWNTGDYVCFVDDDYTDHGKPAYAPHITIPAAPDEIAKFPDRTEDVIRSLIAHGILENAGFTYRDDDEPESVYSLDLRNVWMSDSPRNSVTPPLPPTEFGIGQRMV